MASKISASLVKRSTSKSLNPLALRYQRQSIPPIAEPQQDTIYLPYQFLIISHHLYEAPSLLLLVSELQSGIFVPFLVLPDSCPDPSFGYRFPGSWVHKEGCLNLYNTYKRPHPWSISYNRISYWSERIVEKKKNGKWRFVPPRLKSPRECSIHSQKVWVKKADVEKIKPCSDVALSSPVTDEEQTKPDGKNSVIIKKGS